MKITKYLTNALFSLLLLIGAGGAPAVENVVYFHNDALGSPVAATDGQGQLLWTEDYEPYGKRLEKPATSNQLWFTGKPEESELGLSYFGARWYEPEIGRFHGIDPVDFQEGNIQSFNRYAYANNNPYKYVDPDGKAAMLAIDAGIIGIGAVVIYGGTTPEQRQAIGRAVGDAVGDATAKLRGLGVVTSPIPLITTVLNARSPEVEALNDIIKDLTNGGRNPLSADDTDAALQLGAGLGLGTADHRGAKGDVQGKGRNHWDGGDHIHIETIRVPKGGNHIKAKL